MNSTCPVCDGPAMLLGALGNRRHFRCRDCGAGWSRASRPSFPLRAKRVPPRVEQTCTPVVRTEGGVTQTVYEPNF